MFSKSAAILVPSTPHMMMRISWWEIIRFGTNLEFIPDWKVCRLLPYWIFCEIKWKEDGATNALDVYHYW
jgi:hypothetical protein